MVDTTDTPVLTDTDTTLARGLLMPNPKLMGMLMLMPLSTMVDTMDTPVLTDTVCTTVDTMVDTTDTPTATDTVTLARGLLMPNLKLMLMPLSTMVDTTDTPTDTVDTTADTPTDTVDTTVMAV